MYYNNSVPNENGSPVRTKNKVIRGTQNQISRLEKQRILETRDCHDRGWQSIAVQYGPLRPLMQKKHQKVKTYNCPRA
jgi:hypothetical protein